MKTILPRIGVWLGLFMFALGIAIMAYDIPSKQIDLHGLGGGLCGAGSWIFACGLESLIRAVLNEKENNA